MFYALKYILTIFVVFVFGPVANSQLLYKVISPKTKKVSYIFGTHHAVPVSSLNTIDGVFRSYNDCDVVVGEIILNEDSITTRMAVEAQMQTNIADFLNKNDYILLDSTLKAVVNIRLSDVAYLRPVAIENILLLTLYEQFFPRGIDDTQMDSFFQQIAVQQGKSIYGLETVDEQIEILFHVSSIQQQVKELMLSVRNLPQLKADLNKLNSLYIEGNLDSINHWTKKIENLSPDNYKSIIEDRNLRWTEKLVNLLDIHACFVAVGALHLPGDFGLLSLLSKRGYKVKPI